jgi:hypothetical protein
LRQRNIGVLDRAIASGIGKQHAHRNAHIIRVSSVADTEKVLPLSEGRASARPEDFEVAQLCKLRIARLASCKLAPHEDLGRAEARPSETLLDRDRLRCFGHDLFEAGIAAQRVPQRTEL